MARDVLDASAAGEAPFGVVVDPAGGAVALTGEFDREHAHHLVEALAALVGTEHRRWTVDARQVTLCDAAGLRALVTAHHLARRQGCALVLDRPSPVLHRLLALVGLDELLEVRTDRPAPPPAVGGSRPLPSAGPLRAAHRATTVPAERRP